MGGPGAAAPQPDRGLGGVRGLWALAVPDVLDGLRGRRQLVLRAVTPVLLLGVVLGISLLLRSEGARPTDRPYVIAVSGDLGGAADTLAAVAGARLELIEVDDVAVAVVDEADAGLRLPPGLDEALAVGADVRLEVVQDSTDATSRAAVALLAANLEVLRRPVAVADLPEGADRTVFTVDRRQVELSTAGTRVLGAELVAAVVCLQTAVLATGAANRFAGRRGGGLLAAQLALPVARSRLAGAKGLAELVVGIVAASPVLLAALALAVATSAGSGLTAVAVVLVAVPASVVVLGSVMCAAGVAVGAAARSQEQLTLGTGAVVVAAAVVAAVVGLGDLPRPPALAVVPVVGLVSELRAVLADGGGWRTASLVVALLATSAPRAAARPGHRSGPGQRAHGAPRWLRSTGRTFRASSSRPGRAGGGRWPWWPGSRPGRGGGGPGPGRPRRSSGPCSPVCCSWSAWSRAGVQDVVEDRALVVAVGGDLEGGAELLALLEDDRLELRPSEDPEGDVVDRRASAAVVLPAGADAAVDEGRQVEVVVAYRVTEPSSEEAQLVLLRRLQAAEVEVLTDGAPPSGGVELDVEPLLRDEAVGRIRLARQVAAVAALLCLGVVTAVAGTLGGASERRTSEPLLVLPLRRSSLAAGLALGSLPLAAVQVVAGVALLVLTAAVPGSTDHQGPATLVAMLAAGALAALPLAAVACATGVVAGALGTGTDDAASLGDVLALPFVAVGIVLFVAPAWSPPVVAFAVPGLGQALLVREAVAGTAGGLEVALAALGALVAAAALVALAGRLVGSERRVLRAIR